jgi:anti-sigma B factor antagonist
MNVAREDHGKATLFIIQGQVDMHTSPELRTHLRKALEGRAAPLVVDLTGVAFIDSSGLATLIEALQAVGKYGGKLMLVGLTPAVKNLFKLSNLTSIFDIRETRHEALGA